MKKYYFIFGDDFTYSNIIEFKVVKKAIIGFRYKGLVIQISDNIIESEYNTNKFILFCEIFDNRIYNPIKFPVYVGIYAIPNSISFKKTIYSFKSLISVGNGRFYSSRDCAQKSLELGI